MRKYENVSIDKLKPYERNARTHSDAQVEKIAKSIKEFGFINPVLIDGNFGIIAGHGRVLGAKKLGMTEVPCLFVEDLTKAQKKAYILADNKLALDAGWDDEILKVELNELKDMNFDLSLTGFDDIEINGLEEPQEVVEDEVPEVDEESEPITKLGDIWQLGESRLMCGDSTKQEDVAKLMNGNKADLLLTDPPYGINADKGVSGFGNTKGNKYDDDWDSFTPDKSFFDMILEMPKNAIIFGGNYFTDKLPLGKHWIVWDKVGEIDFQNPYSDCELAWTNIAKESVKKYTVIQQGFVAEEKEKRVHPTQKSVKLFAQIIEDYTDKNNIILDTFCGSGTTFIASEQTDRICYGIEISEKYCDVIVKRWEQFTGKKAVKL